MRWLGVLNGNDVRHGNALTIRPPLAVAEAPVLPERKPATLMRSREAERLRAVVVNDKCETDFPLTADAWLPLIPGSADSPKQRERAVVCVT